MMLHDADGQVAFWGHLGLECGRIYSDMGRSQLLDRHRRARAEIIAAVQLLLSPRLLLAAHGRLCRSRTPRPKVQPYFRSRILIRDPTESVSLTYSQRQAASEARNTISFTSIAPAD